MNLAVERGPGAEDCPNATALNARIASIRGHDDTQATTVYAVGFKRTGTEFSAAIRVGGSSVRLLRTNGERCAALAQATAVTLAMLIDSDESTEPAPLADNEPQPAPVAKPFVAPSASAPRRAPPAATAGVSLGAVALVGVLGSFAPGALADLQLQARRSSVSVGVLWAPPHANALGPGSVRESLFAGTLRACVDVVGDRRLAIDLCTGVFAGATTGDARGFTDNLIHHQAWLAVPVELSLVRRAAPLGWELTASGLAALVEHDFAVDGLGVAYRSPPIGGMLSLHAFLPFFR